ncbi:MAG: hypothetical protein QM500_16405, partial [Methylococcales bacterium]
LINLGSEALTSSDSCEAKASLPNVRINIVTYLHIPVLVKYEKTCIKSVKLITLEYLTYMN